jgi:hypothetical protein
VRLPASPGIDRRTIGPETNGPDNGRNAAMKEMKDWLDRTVGDDWLEQGQPDPFEFCMLAGVLRAQADAEGFGADRLEKMCDGDVAGYLMNREKQASRH